MEFSAKQIASFLQGTYEGDGSVKVTTVSKIEEGKPGSLSFLANPKYTHYIYETSASIVIVNKSFVAEKPIKATLVRVEDAYSSFAKLLEMYQQNKHNRSGVSKKASVPRSAKIGKNVFIGDFVSVGEHVVIGDNTKIYPNTTIHDFSKIGSDCLIYSGVQVLDNSIIGNRCVLQANAVIGSDGFGFAPITDGKYMKIPQIGNVVLEDEVEIGANTSIDRATMGTTYIRKGTKIDNLIQIGHNCEIGENCVIAGQTGISGSTKVGNHCMIGGQVGVAGHLKLGNNLRIAAKSGIISDVEDGAELMGAPAMDARKYKISYLHFMKFKELVQRINDIDKRLKDKEK